MTGDRARVMQRYALVMGRQAVPMPDGAQLLHADQRNEWGQPTVFVWALVPLTSAIRKRDLLVVPTGLAFVMGDPCEHVGTVPTEGTFSAHVFDCGWTDSPRVLTDSGLGGQ